MIIEKLFDSIYEEASRYFTKWRGCSFAFAWVIVSGAFLKFFDKGFWSGGSGDAGAEFISALSGIPFYQFFFFAFTAFYIAPLIANRVAVFFVKIEIRRAEKLMCAIDVAVDKVPLVDLVARLERARKDAIEAEDELQFKKALNEVYVFSLLTLGMLVLVGEINSGFLPFFGLPWCFIVFFLVQEMLLVYYNKIYLFKKLSVRAAEDLQIHYGE